MRFLPPRDQSTDPNLLVGPETFDDAGVYRLADGLAIVQTLDFFPPVVDDPYVYGQIAAANSLSDIYAMGGVPKTAMNLVGFPDDQLPLEILARILEGGYERVKAANAVIVGGHTVRDAEIKFGMAVTGIVDPDNILTNTKARPGDVLYLTKPLGTGFVTTAHKAERCPEKTFAAACDSMVSLNDNGARAAAELGVRSTTDITGFGLAGHANEMAAGSGATIVLRLSSLPLIPGVEALVAKGFRTRASKTNASYVASVVREEGPLDPMLREILYDAQTSGGMLLAVPAENANRAEDVLREHRTLVATRIGEVIEREPGVNLIVQK